MNFGAFLFRTQQSRKLLIPPLDFRDRGSTALHSRPGVSGWVYQPSRGDSRSSPAGSTHFWTRASEEATESRNNHSSHTADTFYSLQHASEISPTSGVPEPSKSTSGLLQRCRPKRNLEGALVFRAGESGLIDQMPATHKHTHPHTHTHTHRPREQAYTPPRSTKQADPRKLHNQSCTGSSTTPASEQTTTHVNSTKQDTSTNPATTAREQTTTHVNSTKLDTATNHATIASEQTTKHVNSTKLDTSTNHASKPPSKSTHPRRGASKVAGLMSRRWTCGSMR